jgi:hypothetical protein
MKRDDLTLSAVAGAHVGKLDGLALVLSAVCLVHCLALPVTLTLLPTLAAGVLEHDDFHRLMLYVGLPTSLMAFGIGCRRHRRLDVAVLGGTGLALLVFATYAVHDWHGELERYITVAGGLILAAAHILNFRACRRSDCDHGT